MKVLQGKLDKQKQQTRELEEALKSTKSAVGGASGTSQPLIDSKVNVHVCILEGLREGEDERERERERDSLSFSTSQRKF